MSWPSPVRFGCRVRLRGSVACGVDRPRVGAVRGRALGTRLQADLVVTFDDLPDGGSDAAPIATLAGTVRFPPLTDGADVEDGTLRLYVADPASGMKQLRQRYSFLGRDGTRYRLEAVAFVRPGRASFREHGTTYARVYAGEGAATRVVAAGVLAVGLRDLAALVWSVRADGVGRVAAVRRLWGYLRHELAAGGRPGPAGFDARDERERRAAHGR